MRSRDLALEQSCATAGATAPRGRWRKILPLGSGRFPPGQGNPPMWKPGKFPLTHAATRRLPEPAVDDVAACQLLRRPTASSGPSTPRRIGACGSTNRPRTSRASCGCSAGSTTTPAGSATTSGRRRTARRGRSVGSGGVAGRGRPAIVVVPRPPLAVRRREPRRSRTSPPTRFLNDVWVSDNGVAWNAGHALGSRGRRATTPVWSCSAKQLVPRRRARPGRRVGARRTARTGLDSSSEQPVERRVTARPPVGLRRQALGVRRVHHEVHQRRQRRLVLRQRRDLETSGRRTRRGRPARRSRRSSGTRSGSTAASTPARPTTGVATSGR